jgi:putative tricarboxylic transport membrane protein
MNPSNTEKLESRPSGSPLKSLMGPMLLFILAVYFYIIAGRIDENPIPGQLGPAFWPRMILLLLMLSCVLKALESFLAFGKGVADVGLSSPPPEVNVPKLVAMIVMVVAVVFFLDILGFALTNFLFLLLFLRIAGLRKKLSLFLVSFLGTIFLLYLFVWVVYLPLPKGEWFFSDLTIFIYRLLHII